MSDHVLERRIAQLEHVVRVGFRDTKLEFTGLRDELRRHMDMVAERLEMRVQVVADGLITAPDHGSATERRLTDPEEGVESMDVLITAPENHPKQ